jgi:CHASE3 domain sensor protein
MIFKILTFVAAAIPIYLFIRAIFFRPSTRANERLAQVKKQVDLAVTIFLVLMGCVVVIMAGELLWTWWASR